jgi:hypothetical protein
MLVQSPARLRTKHLPLYRLKRLWLLVYVSFVLFCPARAAAHPLDEFYQVTYITVAPNRIILKIELYPGVLVAPQRLPLLDSNQDDLISFFWDYSYYGPVGRLIGRAKIPRPTGTRPNIAITTCRSGSK